MQPDQSNTSSGPNDHPFLDDAREFCELLPGAAALWNRDRSICLLNDSAKVLIRYSQADFSDRPSLWVERIHPDDREQFHRSMDGLDKGLPRVQCDYRFFPKNMNLPIWIREQAAFRPLRKGTIWTRISTYSDISQLKSARGPATNKDDMAELARLLIHEFHNRIQKITMELELTQMVPRDRLNFTELVDSIKHSLQDLRDQIARTLERWTLQDLLPIVDGIIRKMRKELSRQNVHLRLVRREPLPMVEGDKDQLRNALEQVFEFCGSMLNNGGELEVEARPTEVGGQVYAELKVTSSSAVSMSEDGERREVGAPEGHRIGMGIMLATEILRRYRGQVSFHKENINRGHVTVLIKGSRQ